MDGWKDVSGEFDVRMTKIRVRGQLVFKKLSTSGVAFLPPSPSRAAPGGGSMMRLSNTKFLPLRRNPWGT